MMLEGWHKLQDGRDALYADGVCVASILIVDGPLDATESWSADGMRSLRNLGTLEVAEAHCERVAGLQAKPEPGAGPGWGAARPAHRA